MEPEKKKRRIRRDPNATRKLILDATERVIVEEGYAAVSTRRVGLEIDLSAATIHYYYPTTDDLFVALHKRMTEEQITALEAIAGAADPLNALWRLELDRDRSALAVEFYALASHRKTIARVFAGLTNDTRDRKVRILQDVLAGSRIDTGHLPPVALALMLTAIARTLTNEERIGTTRGHQEAQDLVEKMLQSVW